jgi:hypothetical protein
MELTETKSTFTLPKRKVQVVPVRRKGGWLPPSHEASFLYKESKFKIGVPTDPKSGRLRNPLTEEEKAYFENKTVSGLSYNPGDLSIHKEGKDNFWLSYEIALDKHVLELDLSDPMDYIAYKVLLTNTGLVAPSIDQKFGKGSYKYALAEQGYEEKAKAKEAYNKREAYKEFDKMSESATSMTNFLNVYNSDKPGHKRIPRNATRDFLESEIERVIESDITGFMSTIKDEHFEEKLLIYTAIMTRAIERDGLSYTLPGGRVIGNSMNEVIGFLKDDANNEEVLKIKSRIDNSL